LENTEKKQHYNGTVPKKIETKGAKIHTDAWTEDWRLGERLLYVVPWE
jgi:hypothetical protein